MSRLPGSLLQVASGVGSGRGRYGQGGLGRYLYAIFLPYGSHVQGPHTHHTQPSAHPSMAYHNPLSRPDPARLCPQSSVKSANQLKQSRQPPAYERSVALSGSNPWTTSRRAVASSTGPAILRLETSHHSKHSRAMLTGRNLRWGPWQHGRPSSAKWCSSSWQTLVQPLSTGAMR